MNLVTKIARWLWYVAGDTFGILNVLPKHANVCCSYSIVTVSVLVSHYAANCVQRICELGAPCALLFDEIPWELAYLLLVHLWTLPSLYFLHEVGLQPTLSIMSPPSQGEIFITSVPLPKVVQPNLKCHPTKLMEPITLHHLPCIQTLAHGHS